MSFADFRKTSTGSACDTDRHSIDLRRREAATGWRPDIQGLRGVAVLSVLIYHAVPLVLPGGFVGVDVFFVVSGYVVGRLLITELAAGRFDYLRFYSRRVRRIFPALAIVLLASLVAGQILLGREDMTMLSQQVAATAVFLANFLAWAQSGYFDQDAAYRPLIHLWSLGVEEQFYAVLPACVALCWKFRRFNAERMLWVAAAISLAFCVWLTAVDGYAAFYLPLTRFWELLAGLLLAWREYEGRPLPAEPNLLAVSGAGLLAGSLFLLAESQSFPGWQAVIPVGSTLLIISAGPKTFVSRYVLSSRPLNWLGAISYAAYLWHWPLLVFSRFLLGRDLTDVQSIGVTFGALLAAWATTRYVETPFRFGVLSRGNRGVLLLVAIVLSAGALASLMPQFSRTDVSSPELKNLETYRAPDGDIWREGENCFVNLNAETDFGATCTGYGSEADPLIALWGDSMAAHLWPGINKVASEYRWRVAQLTVSLCPPLLAGADHANNKCRAMRKRAISVLNSIAPHTVVLAGSWTRYDPKVVSEEIMPTVEMLKTAGVQRVILVGPVPIWRPTLARALAFDMRRMRLEQPPQYTNTGFLDEVYSLDRALRLVTENAGASYLSVLDVLCDVRRKCKVWVDEDRRTILTTYDSGHFSLEHSEWFARRVSTDLFLSSK